MSDFKESLRKIFLEEFAPPEEAFLEIESELRGAARQMGIDYDNALIVNTDSTFRSPKDIGDWSKKQKQWAGFGSSWVNWIAKNMPHWLAARFYVIEVNSLDMVSVNSKKAKQLFEQQYVTRPDAPKDIAINFDKLYEEGKTGVSFRPFNRSWSNYDWYSSIDIDSVVIINNKKIKSVKLLLDASELIADYKDRGSDY